jgi:5-methyltetrahydrofolate--homocysteine methyltransferase
LDGEVSNLIERLQRGEILVGDGAMGTMLFARGLKPGDCPESLNLSHPEVLTEIASAYLQAGADIIQTNTFGGSPLKLVAYGLDGQAREINRQAVESVRKAVGHRALVSGSCGPTGKILKPYGDAEPEEVSAAYQLQTSALIDAGVDIICIETMTAIEEAVLAVTAARQYSADIPVMATMTFDATPRGFFTIMGVTIDVAAQALADAGADVVGSNCGNGIDRMVEIAGEFRKHSKSPLIIQSNAGLPVMMDGQVIYPESPDFMAARVPQLIENRVSIIGGCCGTTPEHIHAIASAVRNYKSNKAKS